MRSKKTISLQPNSFISFFVWNYLKIQRCYLALLIWNFVTIIILWMNYAMIWIWIKKILSDNWEPQGSNTVLNTTSFGKKRKWSNHSIHSLHQIVSSSLYFINPHRSRIFWDAWLSISVSAMIFRTFFCLNAHLHMDSTASVMYLLELKSRPLCLM